MGSIKWVAYEPWQINRPARERAQILSRELEILIPHRSYRNSGLLAASLFCGLALVLLVVTWIYFV